MSLDLAWPAPTAPHAPPPTAPRSERVRRAAHATVAAGATAAAIGIGRPGASVGIAVVMIVGGAAVVRAGVLRGPARRLAAVALAAYIPWLAFRSSPWLLVPDVIAATILLLAAGTARNGAPLRDSIAGYIRRADRALRGALNAPRRAVLGIQAELTTGWRRALRQSLVPAVLGLSIAFVIAGILASGDAVFASYLEFGDLVTTALARFVAAGVVMAIVVGLSGAAAAAEQRPPIPARRHGSGRSAIIAIAPLVVVYVAYVAVQCSTLVLGADYVRRRTGLTFAEYARSGFFQLVAVAAVTFTCLAVLRPIVRSADGRDRRILRVLAVVATVCTMAMVVAAIVKLDLYADVFGLTMLRIYTSVFAAWLGVALGIGLWSLFRPRGEWVVPLVATTALVGVFAMNVANPERIVARHNLTETIQSDEFDIDYLLGLSPDAVPLVVDHLDDLAPAERDRALLALCGASTRSGWLDWNAAADRAEHATDNVC